jgi:hypothetical protein
MILWCSGVCVGWPERSKQKAPANLKQNFGLVGALEYIMKNIFTWIEVVASLFAIAIGIEWIRNKYKAYRETKRPVILEESSNDAVHAVLKDYRSK